MNKLKNIVCYFLNHHWVYNSPISSIPNKAMFKRCYVKSKLNLTTLDWYIVENFDGENRTNQELADNWF